MAQEAQEDKGKIPSKTDEEIARKAKELRESGK